MRKRFKISHKKCEKTFKIVDFWRKCSISPQFSGFLRDSGFRFRRLLCRNTKKRLKLRLLKWSVVRKIWKKLEKNNKKHVFFVSLFGSIALNKLCREVAEKSVFSLFFEKDTCIFAFHLVKNVFFCAKSTILSRYSLWNSFSLFCKNDLPLLSCRLEPIKYTKIRKNEKPRFFCRFLKKHFSITFSKLFFGPFWPTFPIFEFQKMKQSLMKKVGGYFFFSIWYYYDNNSSPSTSEISPYYQ